MLRISLHHEGEDGAMVVRRQCRPGSVLTNGSRQMLSAGVLDSVKCKSEFYHMFLVQLPRHLHVLLLCCRVLIYLIQISEVSELEVSL